MRLHLFVKVNMGYIFQKAIPKSYPSPSLLPRRGRTEGIALKKDPEAIRNPFLVID